MDLATMRGAKVGDSFTAGVLFPGLTDTQMQWEVLSLEYRGDGEEIWLLEARFMGVLVDTVKITPSKDGA